MGLAQENELGACLELAFDDLALPRPIVPVHA
jgi:hypothetical protein